MHRFDSDSCQRQEEEKVGEGEVVRNGCQCKAPSDMKSVKRALLDLEWQLPLVSLPSVYSACRVTTLQAPRLPALESISVCWSNDYARTPASGRFSPTERMVRSQDKVISPLADVEIYDWVCLATVIPPSSLP